MISPSVLVIIYQVYLDRVSRLESEGNPPVLRHSHCPFTLSVALLRMGAERQEVQIFYFFCCVQCVQEKINPGPPLRVDPPVVSIFKRFPKDLGSKPLDHAGMCTIKCYTVVAIEPCAGRGNISCKSAPVLPGGSLVEETADGC